MPRPRSENTEPINLKIPLTWVETADWLARSGAFPTELQPSRTAMLRHALGYGLAGLREQAEKHASRGSRRQKGSKP
jgi:hypothetical protein